MQASTDSLTGVPIIPAMTTDAERECYYRLAREAAGKGEVVELGAWLGASTAYIAAGLRDAGGGVVRVFDKFLSKPGHVTKVNAFFAKRGLSEADMPLGDAMGQFQRNLGPLMAHVEARKCQIETVKWDRGPIALMVTDAPKRVPHISSVLTNFGPGLVEGTVMAWQDFCHFPSYEIPACLFRLRDHLEFVKAAVPGTTLVFRIKSRWTPEEVSLDALSLSRWTPEEIGLAWMYWDKFVPTEKAALFRCGMTMFLCDIGQPGLAVEFLEDWLHSDADAILPKWRYLHDARPDFRKRYKPLFDLLAKRGALEPC